MEKKTKKNRRTTMPKYSTNPFLRETAELTTTKSRTIFANNAQQCAVVDLTTAEAQLGQVGICYRKEVDTNEFVKLYAEGLGQIMDLSSAGSKVFKIIYGQLYGKEGMNRTQIILNYAMLSDTETKNCSEATFQRGIKDCIKHRLIAQSLMPGVYFINPSYIFNGSRIALVRSYVNKDREDLTDTKSIIE